VGPRAGQDRSGKSRLHQDSIPGPTNPERVAIPTTLPGPLFVAVTERYFRRYIFLLCGHIVECLSLFTLQIQTHYFLKIISRLGAVVTLLKSFKNTTS
jgi:hypothetical protein